MRDRLYLRKRIKELEQKNEYKSSVINYLTTALRFTYSVIVVLIIIIVYLIIK
jgi:hypothetical protein